MRAVDQSEGMKTIGTSPMGIKVLSFLTLTLTLGVNEMLMMLIYANEATPWINKNAILFQLHGLE